MLSKSNTEFFPIKTRQKTMAALSNAPPAEREASGSLLEVCWIKRSSIKIRNMKHEMRNVIKKYGTQIFTDFHRYFFPGPPGG